MARSLRAYAGPLQLGLFGLLPLILTAFFVDVAVEAHAFAVDFHSGDWAAGVRILHGLTPYYAPRSTAILFAGGPQATVTPMVYPALGGLLFAPLALLPHTVADAVFTALDMAAVLLTLKLLRIRDRRLYGLAFLWAPVISGWQTANLTLLLGLGLALLWRHRDRATVAGLVVAALVSIKLILWPLGIWLVATRRYAAGGFAIAFGLVVNLVAWGILGFGELPRYVHVLRALDAAAQHRAYSTLNFAEQLGASQPVAMAIALIVATATATACYVAGRHGRERVAFSLCVGVALLSTPIIWLHYFALLLVPLALARPRLSPVWLLPIVLIVCPATGPSAWQTGLVLAVAGAIVLAASRSIGRPIEAPPGSSWLGRVGAAGVGRIEPRRA